MWDFQRIQQYEWQPLCYTAWIYTNWFIPTQYLQFAPPPTLCVLRKLINLQIMAWSWRINKYLQLMCTEMEQFYWYTAPEMIGWTHIVNISITVMLWLAPWLASRITRVSIEKKIKENIKTPRHWLLWGESNVTLKMAPFGDVIMSVWEWVALLLAL